MPNLAFVCRLKFHLISWAPGPGLMCLWNDHMQPVLRSRPYGVFERVWLQRMQGPVLWQCVVCALFE